MKTYTCPRCFTKSDIQELAWGCSNSDCDREAVPTTSVEASPACTSCGKDMTMRFCPACGFQILTGRDSIKTIPISIVGSERSGKSHYLSVLINEVRHTMGRAYDFSLFPLGGDDTIIQYEDLYYKPLYEEGVALPATMQENVRPLVYSMVFDNRSVGETCTLAFYDACGANFRNERVMADYNRSIYNSKGVIFLLDPSQIPNIRKEYIAEDKPVLADDFSALFARTIQLIREGNNQMDLKKKIDIPIAICVSKLDLLKPKLNPSSYLNYPSRHFKNAAFDTIDHDCVSQEIEARILSWGGADIINQVKAQFENYSFFGFSALGTSPMDDGSISHVAPFRVCDPFMWLLTQEKIIKAKKHNQIDKSKKVKSVK